MANYQHLNIRTDNFINWMHGNSIHVDLDSSLYLYQIEEVVT